MNDDRRVNHNSDANPDPITGKPGAHPVGTGVGAAGVGAVGTAIGGAVGGPIGAVVGAAVGAVAGGLAGKGVAEKVDPTVEDDYWRHNYQNRPYVESGYNYDDYSPAYRTGYEGYSTYSQQGLSYNDAEPHLRQNYERQHGNNRLGWDKAQHATRDAWNRVERAVPGYAAEDQYWRTNYTSRPYRDTNYDYNDYGPAYRTGYEGYSTYSRQGMSFNEAEPHLKRDYERQNSNSRLSWDKAKHAIQDAWHRVEMTTSGNRSNRR